MAKKSVITGEYILSVLDNGSIEIYRIYDNAKGALREVAEKEGFEYDANWTTRQFGSKLIDFLLAKKAGCVGKVVESNEVVDAVEADDIVESEEYGCQLEKFQPLEAGRASLELSDVKAQDDFYFLYIPFNECCVDDYIDTLKNEDNEADIARSKAVLHDQIGGTISDIDCGETVAHDTCGILENDGVYVEIKDNGRYGWEVDNEVSKAYLVIDGKVVYGDVYGDYSESSGRYGYGCRLNKFQRIEAGRSFQRPNKIKSQDGFTFLYIPGFDVENWLYTIQCDESEEDIAKTKAAIHSEIRDIICDIKNGENISHQMCDILDEDGAYIEVKHLLTTDEISKVYLVYWGDVAYGDVFNRYSESDDKYGPFTDEIVGE